MKFILTFVLFLFVSFSVQSSTPRVLDGDTVDTGISYEGLPTVKLRLFGIDTPEMKGKCDLEKQKAREAKEFLEKLISSSNRIEIKFLAWDKYGGRAVGHLLLDGKSASDTMIEKGHGISYFGEKKNHSWCN